MPLKYQEATDAPVKDQVVDSTRGLTLTDIWQQWFGRLSEQLKSVPNVMNVSTLTSQAASLAATDFAGTSLLPGLYRATYRAQITQAATVSSTLTVSIHWTVGGVAQTATGDAIVGNTTTTGQSDSILLQADKGTAVQYSTVYGSVGLTEMRYSFSVSLEKVKL